MTSPPARPRWRFSSTISRRSPMARCNPQSDRMMRSAARMPLLEVMASLINDLTTSAAPLAIFLDDFQEITDGAVQSAVRSDDALGGAHAAAGGDGEPDQ